MATSTDAQARTAGRTNDRGILSGYSPEEPMPLGGCATLLGAWSTGMAAFLAAFGDRLPRHVSWSDFALVSLATHKLSRIITKDWVTSPVRAPFVRYQKSIGGGEVDEKARGRGLRRALGELLTCHFCIAPWVAAALAGGFALKPRATRYMATVFGAVAISDALQNAYDSTKRLSRS